ncbi:UNVERIFIED_CONTAM: hypothetical protein HHA_449460 [Hammondia hammondi]|eukprot:XP_008882127.1 hypothetical protein HHA_449460 [Hammondia hammondi]
MKLAEAPEPPEEGLRCCDERWVRELEWCEEREEEEVRLAPSEALSPEADENSAREQSRSGVRGAHARGEAGRREKSGENATKGEESTCEKVDLEFRQEATGTGARQRRDARETARETREETPREKTLQARATEETETAEAEAEASVGTEGEEDAKEGTEACEEADEEEALDGRNRRDRLEGEERREEGREDTERRYRRDGGTAANAAFHDRAAIVGDGREEDGGRQDERAKKSDSRRKGH